MNEEFLVSASHKLALNEIEAPKLNKSPPSKSLNCDEMRQLIDMQNEQIQVLSSNIVKLTDINANLTSRLNDIATFFTPKHCNPPATPPNLGVFLESSNVDEATKIQAKSLVDLLSPFFDMQYEFYSKLLVYKLTGEGLTDQAETFDAEDMEN